MIDLFSEGFATSIFNRNAAELKVDKSFESTVVDAEGLWDALKRYTSEPEVLKARNPQCEAVTAIDNARTGNGTDDRLLPNYSDRSLDDYIDRVEGSQIGDQEWAVAYFGLYAAAPRFWDAANHFAKNLARSLGYSPAGRVDIDCFIGRYSSTHTGVHVDYAHNFAFSLRPGKTMYTWSQEHSELLGLKAPDYESAKSQGTALLNTPGVVAYFPQDALHVAESPKQASVVVNVTFWDTAEFGQVTHQALTSGARARTLSRTAPMESGPTGLNFDDEHNILVAEAVSRDISLRRSALVHQLIDTTSRRIGIGRPTVPVPDDLRSTPLKTNPDANVQWTELPGLDEILIGMNGHVTSVPYGSDVASLLENILSTGDVDSSVIETLIRRGGRESILMPLYGRMVEWGVLELA